MGSHHNGDNPPPDGDRSPDEPVDLPDLPSLPEGVAIPDDASELASEAEQIRAELSGEAATAPDPSGPAGPGREPSPAVPLVIMSVAVAITLVSLFAMTWTGNTSPERAEATEPLPDDVVLTDDTGQQRNVATLAPMVILLVEACQNCEELVGDTVDNAPGGVTVVVVADSPRQPGTTAPGGNVVRLVDTDGVLRSALGLRPPPMDAATVVVADRERVIRTTPATTTTESFADAMATLGNR